MTLLDLDMRMIKEGYRSEINGLMSKPYLVATINTGIMVYQHRNSDIGGKVLEIIFEDSENVYIDGERYDTLNVEETLINVKIKEIIE